MNETEFRSFFWLIGSAGKNRGVIAERRNRQAEQRRRGAEYEKVMLLVLFIDNMSGMDLFAYNMKNMRDILSSKLRVILLKYVQSQTDILIIEKSID